jgi:MFS family permease
LFVWPYATNSSGIIGFAFWCGLGSGGYFSLQSSIVAQIVGTHKINQGIGYIELATSFGVSLGRHFYIPEEVLITYGLPFDTFQYFLGPITAGILLDAFGGSDQGAKPYRPAMYLVGATTTVSFLLVVWVRISYQKRLWSKA